MIVADHAYARRSCTNKPNELREYAETRPSKAATRWRPRTRVKVHSWLLVSHGLDNSWPVCVIALPTIVVVILGRRMCRVSELAVRRAALPCLQVVFSTSIYINWLRRVYCGHNERLQKTWWCVRVFVCIACDLLHEIAGNWSGGYEAFTKYKIVQLSVDEYIVYYLITGT